MAIAVSGHHNLAISEDGSLYAWGYNYYGQLGIGTAKQEDHIIPLARRAVGPEFNSENAATSGALLGDGNASGRIVAIAAGGHGTSYAYSLALDERGTVYGFGRNYDRIIDNSAGDISINVPRDITKWNSEIYSVGISELISDDYGQTRSSASQSSSAGRSASS